MGSLFRLLGKRQGHHSEWLWVRADEAIVAHTRVTLLGVETLVEQWSDMEREEQAQCTHNTKLWRTAGGRTPRLRTSLRQLHEQ